MLSSHEREQFQRLRNLWAAVLERAVLDARNTPDSAAVRPNARDVRRARTWIERRRNTPTGFGWACDAVGVELDTVAEASKRGVR